MKKSFLLVSLLLCCATVMAREWTNAAGKKILADLMELKGPVEELVAVLKLPNGQLYQVPLTQLSIADQTFAKMYVATRPATPGPGPSPAEEVSASMFKDLLKNKLVAVDGKRVSKYEMKAEPKYYAFYFSAHWCPPCRSFTPKLVSFYNSSEGKKTDFEVIFVSRDRDESAMEQYMLGDQMPWPAISYRNLDRMKEIQKYSGNGIPCLVLVDQHGEVISHSYEGENYVGPTKVMRDIAVKTKG